MIDQMVQNAITIRDSFLHVSQDLAILIQKVPAGQAVEIGKMKVDWEGYRKVRGFSTF